MGLTTFQVCMDNSSVDWLQETIHEEGGIIMDSSSPPSLLSSSPTCGVDNILTCSRPLMERRLRPQHDQALKCPRCDSTHTKFCYYNNYSLSQPRYFCKTCRRYWTKGGTLRNIPVGGGCRKNKKSSSSSNNNPSSSSSSPNTNKKSSSSSSSPIDHHHHHQSHLIHPHLGSSSSSDLHLSFPEGQFGNFHQLAPNFMGIENPTPIDFLGNTNVETYNNNQFGMMMMSQTFAPTNNNTLCPQFGISIDGNNVGPTTHLMIPYDDHHHHDHDYHDDHHQFNVMKNHHHDDDVKPNPKILSLEWHDHHQGCSDAGNYINGLGSWTGLVNAGYGSSTTNPLV